MIDNGEKKRSKDRTVSKLILSMILAIGEDGWQTDHSTAIHHNPTANTG